MTATEAQVAAAMEALLCAPTTKARLDGLAQWCDEHKRWIFDRGCPAAVQAADAVVAAGPDPAKVRRGRYCGCGWCCANNPPGVVPGDGHRNCSASKATS